MSIILYSIVRYIAGKRGLVYSIKAVNGSIIVYRRVGSFYKGSRKRSGVLREGIGRIGV